MPLGIGNRPLGRPGLLQLGTQADNVGDMVDAGRNYTFEGPKLTSKDAAAIHGFKFLEVTENGKARPFSRKEVAAMFNVGEKVVQRVWNYHTYRKAFQKEVG